MKKFVTFGELMLRLSPPGHEVFMQTPAFTATFGGAEANVAVSLANYGCDVSFVTALPKNPLAGAARAQRARRRHRCGQAQRRENGHILRRDRGFDAPFEGRI